VGLLKLKVLVELYVTKFLHLMQIHYYLIEKHDRWLPVLVQREAPVKTVCPPAIVILSP
jgi:hypothetical protein